MDNFFVLFLCIISLVNTQKTKRLLLNDPDVIGSRLSNIEKSMQEMKAEFGQEKTKMQTTISQLQTALTQVLKGFATGQEYSHGTCYGGPANYLCLPNNPELSNITGPGRSLLYGTEFEHGDYFKKGADQEDVPCALCRSENTSTTVMIPGRQTWKKWNIMVSWARMLMNIKLHLIFVLTATQSMYKEVKGTTMKT
ncbi:unnamed protein product [Mytilus coruscus]|uniref:Uncharacterized protein n=1 Tax=Mytilus coruscus TaxID=42192 RepID=A0A6J8EIT9_MYTCO|nr:unnamed protein product [Mytilus coruscus]